MTRIWNPIHTWQRVAFAMLFLLSIFAAINGNRAYAAPPPAGTSIGNQASATYADALGNAQTPVTSNTVVTTVSQVASFTLTAAQTKTGAPGTQVYFPHTLTNFGNGTDTFDLSVANLSGGTFDFSSVAIYADANGDGVPDNARFCRKVWYLGQNGKTDHNYFKNLQCQKLTKNKLCDRTLQGARQHFRDRHRFTGLGGSTDQEMQPFDGTGNWDVGKRNRLGAIKVMPVWLSGDIACQLTLLDKLAAANE